MQPRLPNTPYEGFEVLYGNNQRILDTFLPSILMSFSAQDIGLVRLAMNNGKLFSCKDSIHVAVNSRSDAVLGIAVLVVPPGPVSFQISQQMIPRGLELRAIEPHANQPDPEGEQLIVADGFPHDRTALVDSLS